MLTEAGLDAETLIAGASNPDIKAALIANTQRAAQVGACGVPTFLIEQSELTPMLIWGQDRLDLVEEALAGWRPDSRGHITPPGPRP